MRFSRSAFGIVLVVLAVMTMLWGACAKESPPPPVTTPVPTGNQPPVISSLLAQNQQLYPSGTTEIQCIAQDADGDRLDFKWAATGGNFSGAGAIVIWQAPPNYGTYTVTVTVDDGKGGSMQASLPVTVGANQSPAISELVANPSGILYGGSTTLTCMATDPDGDVVRYSWSSSEGSITGVGNKVTWIAPSKGGNYNVTVVVSDGKGGETRGDVMVTVSAAVRTVTITPVAEETGTVDSGGDKDNSRTMAGDDDKNIGYHAFWSFNVWNLAGKNIQNATLRLTTRSIAGDPFPSATGLAGLRFWKVSYGDKLPNFNFTGSNLINVTLQTRQPTSLDVTQEIANVAAAASTRFQVEALFMKVTNGNNVAEFIEWSEAVLEVTYSDK
ncbi:MAG: PKD domain-containing protein [Dehalococcoidia bacterium]